MRARGRADGVGESLGGERGEEAVPAAAEEHGQEAVDVARGDGVTELDERGERRWMGMGRVRELAIAAGDGHGRAGGGVERSERRGPGTPGGRGAELCWKLKW